MDKTRHCVVVKETEIFVHMLCGVQVNDCYNLIVKLPHSNVLQSQTHKTTIKLMGYMFC